MVGLCQCQGRGRTASCQITSSGLSSYDVRMLYACIINHAARFRLFFKARLRTLPVLSDQPVLGPALSLSLSCPSSLGWHCSSPHSWRLEKKSNFQAERFGPHDCMSTLVSDKNLCQQSSPLLQPSSLYCP